MYEFTPSEEQKMLVDAIQRYASTDVRKVAHESDEASEIDASVIGKGWNLGVLPGLIPEEYGGYAEDQPTVTGVLALEELAWGDLSVAMALWSPALFAMPMLMSGTEEQKKTYLPRFCDADWTPLTAAVIEPSIKFDPWRPMTTASASNGHVMLSGEKYYVPFADEAEEIIVYATNQETGKVDGYIVPRDTEGLQVVDRNKLMGIRGLPTFHLKLSDVKVDAARRVGGDDGVNYQDVINRSRIAIGAMAVGVARASYEYARDYAKERVQFGVPIATKQAIAFLLADMAIEIDAARMLVWEAAWQVDQGTSGKELVKTATQVKNYIDKMSLFVTDSGVQVLGGHGYIREHPVERWLRNARGFPTFDGLALV